MSGITLKIALRQIVRSPGRTILTALAMAASVCLVVWIVAGFDAVIGHSDTILKKMLGPYDMILSAEQRKEVEIPKQLLADLRSRKEIHSVDPAMRCRTKGINPSDEFQPPHGPSLIGTASRESRYKITEGRWLNQDDPSVKEAVLTDADAERFQLEVGDEFVVRLLAGDSTLQLVGLVEQPFSMPGMGGVYVTMDVATEISGGAGRVNQAMIRLRQGADSQAVLNWFEKEVAKKQKKGLKLQDLEILKGVFENSPVIMVVQIEGLFASGIAFLAATFIIMTALGMGIRRRIRQLAVLRSIGMTRTGVIVLVFIESFLIALIGWLLGILGGWLLLQATTWLQPDIFQGAILGLSLKSLLISGGCASFGALIAGVIPAWSASRLRPVDAMARGSIPAPRRVLAWSSGIGLILVGVYPAVIFGNAMSIGPLYWSGVLVGALCMAVGFIILSPAVVRVAEWVFGYPVAKIFGIEPQLLARQLSGSPWRSVGTTLSLSVGLALYVTIQVWGFSILEPFLPGDNLPDMVVSIMPGGVSPSRAEEMLKVSGVDASRSIPLAIGLGDITSKFPKADARAKELILLGVDPQKSFQGESPVLGVDFVQGDPVEAVARLKQGRYCLVTDTFHSQTGLGPGDSISADVLGVESEANVTYEIVGVISLKGGHFVTRMTGARRERTRDGKPGRQATLFAGFDQVQKDFEIENMSHFWINMTPDANVPVMRAKLQKIAETSAGIQFDLPLFGKVTAVKPYVMIFEMRALADMIRERAAIFLWISSIFPLITLGLAALGVAAAVTASIQARRFELGVLRGIGLTRTALLRMVMAESVLIGIAACVLSLAAGVLTAYGATGISTQAIFQQGEMPTLIIPWFRLSVGFGAALLLCFIAAAIPAIRAAMTAPLNLLSAGE